VGIKNLVKKNAESQVRLKKEASENTTTSKKRGKDAQVPLKQGKPLDHTPKHQARETTDGTCKRVVGMSKGCTVNMENYESFRVDVWLTDFVLPDETQEEALDRISEIIDKQIQEEVDNLE